MTNNYLITGYWGEPHITTENDRGIYASIFGSGKHVLPVGEQFRAEYIGNNTIRMYDGKLIDNGAIAGIPVGEYFDCLIANAGQGMTRNDLIIFQYTKDSSTMIERGIFTVIQGTETSGTPTDPELITNDLLSGNASFDQMALWRITVTGTTISAPTRIAEVEWANPPMIPGVEYRTTERYNGQPVYTKLFNTGELANGGKFAYTSTKVKPIRHAAICGSSALPLYAVSAWDGGWSLRCDVDGENVTAYMGTSRSTANIDVQVWYTKY